MNTKGTKFLAVLAVLAMAFAIFAVAPTLDAAEKIIHVDGDQDSADFAENQIVLVDGVWSIGDEKTPAVVVIRGELQVPEGSKVIIAPNSTIIMMGGSAYANIEGTVTVEEKVAEDEYDPSQIKMVDGKTTFAEFVVAAELDPDYMPDQGFYIADGAVDVAGVFTVNGIMALGDGELTVKADGSYTVGSTGSLKVGEEGSVIVDKGAIATIKGKVGAQKIENSGTVILNTAEAITDDVNIYQAADGAVVDIQKVVIGPDTPSKVVKISDEGLDFYSYKPKQDDPHATDIEADDKVHYRVGTTFESLGSFPVNTVTLSANITDTAGHTQAVITKLSVIEKVSSVSGGAAGDDGYVDKNKRTYNNIMNIEGNVAVKAELNTDEEAKLGTATAKVEIKALRGAEVAADTTLDINSNVTLDNSKDVDDLSLLTVAGKLNANHGSSTTGLGAITNTGIIKMSGVGIMEVGSPITFSEPAEIIGAMIDFADFVQYMKLDLAIEKANADSNIEDIKVVGNDDVSKTATVRADVTITADSDFTVGAENNDVVLTMAKGSALKPRTYEITVGGTLFAEDKSNVSARDHILSDVYSEQINESGKPVSNGWAKWTNLITALNEATYGTKVEVKTEGPIVLASNAEIKEGVTLYVPSDCEGLILKDGVTLTVNGTYDNNSEIYAQTIFDIAAKNVEGNRSSAIVVNGIMLGENNYAQTKNETDYFASDDSITFKVNNKYSEDGAPIAGAYYSAKIDDNTYEVISPLEIAILDLEDLTDDILINGAVNAGDIVFGATDSCSIMTVNVGIDRANGEAGETIDTVLTVSSLVLSDSSLVLAIGDDDKHAAIFSGTVTDVFGSIKLKNASSTDHEKVAAVEDSEDGLEFSGAWTYGKNGSISVSDGLVTASATSTKSISVGSGATLIAGTSPDFTTMTVNGTVFVDNGKTLNVGTMTVYGNVDVEEATATSAAGRLTVETMYVGIGSTSMGTVVKESATSATAVITGPVEPSKKVVILAGSSIDEIATVNIEKLVNVTEFYVKDALWITVRIAGGVEDYISDEDDDDGKLTYHYTPTDLKDSIFASWQNDKGVDVTGDKLIGAVTKVYANIDYDIYSVKIVTDSGIKAVSIDNIQMLRAPSSAMGTNTFTTLHNIEAGSHKVTYTLQDGYEGTAKLYTEYGTILQDLGFTVSGTDDDDRELTLQLYGTEKEVPAPTPEPEKESEWTVTTILLLILVILIAIMAVIVAMRLMRS